MVWKIEINEVLPRAEVHARCSDANGEGGGEQQGGIATPKACPDVLLFDLPAGDAYGYTYDGARDDGTYHYTGKGQSDQKFIGGNRAVRDHQQRGLTLRLFKRAKGEKGVRYLGAYRLDRQQPYYYGESRNRAKNLRKVIVFRLRPIGAPVDADPPMRPVQVTVEDIDLDRRATDPVLVTPTLEPKEAEQREFELVERYTRWLKRHERPAIGKRVHLSTPGVRLECDLYDLGIAEIVEAKSSAARPYVRLALGQLLDYQRYIEAASSAALFPSRPVNDLVELLNSHGIVCIYEDEDREGEFHRLSP